MFLIEFWNSLILGQQIFLCIAVPATVLLVVLIVTMLFGMGDSDADADLDGDGDFDADDVDGDLTDAGLSFFTLRGIVAMLSIMGWSGLVFLDPSLNIHWAVGAAISLALGVLALFLVALAMRGISRLQSSGNLDVGNAIGKVAQVYLTIPAEGKSAGKVSITVQEQLTELSAITTSAEPIPTGAYVRVVAVSENGALVVEPLGK